MSGCGRGPLAYLRSSLGQDAFQLEQMQQLPVATARQLVFVVLGQQLHVC